MIGFHGTLGCLHVDIMALTVAQFPRALDTALKQTDMFQQLLISSGISFYHGIVCKQKTFQFV